MTTSEAEDEKEKRVYELLTQELERAYVGLNGIYGFFVQAVVLATTVVGGLIIYVYPTDNANLFL